MTQTLDLLDVDARFAQRDGTHAIGAPESATQTKVSKFGTFATTFGIAFAVLYTVFERLNWPLFTFHPVLSKLDFRRESAGVGPPMFWYGWLTLSAISALVVGLIAANISGQWLRRATVFCCALAALWPAALAGLRIYILDYAPFDADFLDSVWLAAIPALVIAATFSWFASSQFVERMWTRLLLIMPIGGLVVLGYSLKPWFVR
jgi:hypothetical protein